MNPVPGRVSSRRRWCSFLLCKKRAHRGDWAKTTHSNLSCGGGASTCRNGQARRRHLTKRSFISKVELMATPRALSRITTTERGRVTWRRSGRCSVCTGFCPRPLAQTTKLLCAFQPAPFLLCPGLFPGVTPFRRAGGAHVVPETLGLHIPVF